MRAAAARRREQAKLQADLLALQKEQASVWRVPEGVTDPFLALAWAVHATFEHCIRLQAKLMQEQPEALFWGKTRTERQLGNGIAGSFANVRKEAKPSVLATTYQQERDRLAEYSSLAIRAGLRERRQELDQAEATLMAQWFRAVLEDPRFEATVAQRELAGELAAEHLRRLDGGSVDAHQTGVGGPAPQRRQADSTHRASGHDSGSHEHYPNGNTGE
ncbi:MAG: hypothetical protein ACRENY_08655 [Candidatus Dormibacteria bacterium]